MLGIGSLLGIGRIMIIRWEADEEILNKFFRQIIWIDRFKKNKMTSGSGTENVFTTPVISSNASPVPPTNPPTTMGIDIVDYQRDVGFDGGDQSCQILFVSTGNILNIVKKK